MRKPSRCRRTAVPPPAGAGFGRSGRQPTLLSWRLKWPNRRSQDYVSAETERHLEAEQRPATARRPLPTTGRQRVMTTLTSCMPYTDRWAHHGQYSCRAAVLVVR